MSVDPNFRTVAAILGESGYFTGNTYALLDVADRIVSALNPSETHHERCVRLAVNSREVMDYMRDNRKIPAIKALRSLGSTNNDHPDYIGLKSAKDAVESQEVAIALLRYKLTGSYSQ